MGEGQSENFKRLQRSVSYGMTTGQAYLSNRSFLSFSLLQGTKQSLLERQKTIWGARNNLIFKGSGPNIQDSKNAFNKEMALTSLRARF